MSLLMLKQYRAKRAAFDFRPEWWNQPQSGWWVDLSLPAYRIADENLAVVQNLTVHAASPSLAHRGLKARRRSLHVFTRTCLAHDAEATVADSQDAFCRAGEIQARYDQICTACRTIERRANAKHHLIPALTRHDGDLTPASLVCVALETSTGHKASAVLRIHRTSVESLDEDSVKGSHQSVFQPSAALPFCLSSHALSGAK